MTFVLASNNKKKLAEMRKILGELGLAVLSQSEAGLSIEVEETGTTFEENSLLKAMGACDMLDMPCIADDSGLCVDALNGEPGVYSARYGGDSCHNDTERYELLLRNLEGVENRRARFVSCITCVFPNGERIVCRGECEGEILTSPRGEGGFGYDPVFLPLSSEKTMAELTSDEKNAISHRGKALEKFKEKLREYHADK
ncbi:MAG: XTP/dITP diphosphatase [Candidatus Heteroscillospira sp.]|jgi:XTP/dITP diphosphohydrolase